MAFEVEAQRKQMIDLPSELGLKVKYSVTDCIIIVNLDTDEG